MNILNAPSEEAFYQLAAMRIAWQMIDRPNAVVGFATGRTTTGSHAALAEIWKQYRFDTSRVTFFGMDEVTGVPRSYFGSCYDMLLKQIVEPLEIPMHNYLMPPTVSEDMQAECGRFNAALAQRGTIDFQELGIGENGHMGFNQPGTALDARTHLGEMDERLNRRIHDETGIPDTVHLGGITLGIYEIMQTRHIMLCANGKNKTDIVEEALFGPVTDRVPTSVLQLHPSVDVILDPLAGEKVKKHLAK